MGETALRRGLIPLDDAGADLSADLHSEWLWLALAYHAHRFGGRPIGEVLCSWTTILLLDRGLRPTVGEIARASGLPRPTVSRYISHTIEQGWAEERVNPDDRRRRELHLTKSGERELESIVELLRDLSRDLLTGESGAPSSDSGSTLLARLARLSSRIKADVA